MEDKALDLLVGQFFMIKSGEGGGLVGVLKRESTGYVIDSGDGKLTPVFSKEELIPHKYD